MTTTSDYVQGENTAIFGMGNALKGGQFRPEIHIAPTESVATKNAFGTNAKFCTYMMN